MNLITPLMHWLERHSYLAVSVIILLTLAAAWQVRGLRINNGLEIWFPQDDPDLKRYQDFLAAYGSDETVVIALDRNQGFRDPHGQDLLAACHAAVAGIDGIHAVLSPPAVPVAGVPSPWFSADGTVALIVAALDREATTEGHRAALLAKIDSVLGGYPVTIHKAGIGVLYEALNQVSLHDAALLLSVSVVLVIALLWWLQRCLYGIVTAVSAILLATIWSMGLYTWTGYQLNMVTMILPSLILVVGLATVIHIVNGLQNGSAASAARGDLAWLRYIAGPCLLSALTSAAGFASLAGSKFPVLREFGLFAALGVLLAVLLTLAICILLMQRRSMTRITVQRRLVAVVACRLCNVALVHPRRVLLMAVVLALAGVIGATRLEVDTFTQDYLLPGHPVRRDADFIESRVGPYTPLDFTVRVHRSDLDPAVLYRSLSSWLHTALETGAAGWSMPPADTYDSGMGEQTAGTIPRSLRITFGIRMQSARGIQQTISRLAHAAKLPQGVEIEAGGYLPLYTRIINHLVETQIISMGVAFLVVFTIIGLIFRSLRLVLIAVIVNVLPILVMLGLMGCIGIRIDVASVTITAVVLGLIVDDTIHILHRLQHEFRGNHAAALRRVMETTGPALVTTTLLLVTGFGVLLLAQVKSIIWFGVLMSSAAAGALVADLMVLPALVVTWRPSLYRHYSNTAVVLPGEF